MSIFPKNPELSRFLVGLMVKTSHTHNRIVWLMTHKRILRDLSLNITGCHPASISCHHVKKQSFLAILVVELRHLAMQIGSWEYAESKGTQCQSMPHQGSTYFFWEIPCSLWTIFFQQKKARNSPHSTKGSKRKEGMNGCQWATGLTRLILPETIPWKRRFLLETIIFRGYVSFRECNHCYFPWDPANR